jgi:hypothetical protein
VVALAMTGTSRTVSRHDASTSPQPPASARSCESVKAKFQDRMFPYQYIEATKWLGGDPDLGNSCRYTSRGRYGNNITVTAEAKMENGGCLIYTTVSC